MGLVQRIKDILRGWASRLGYQIIRGGPPLIASADSPYGAIIAGATYSPWAADEVFQSTLKEIESATLVDLYRNYELWSLVEQTWNLPGALLEVGVWRGGTGALIARRAELSGIVDPVYLCDTFTGVVKATKKDWFYRGGEHRDASRADVEDLVYRRMNLKNVRIVEGVFPESAPAELGSAQFRFCHIDVDVYRSASDILEWLWDRLVVGGIVVYDDYGFPRTSGITKHVDEQRGLPGRLVIYNLNGHAILIKLS